MNCSKCGNWLDARSVFCPRCGTPAPVANNWGQGAPATDSWLNVLGMFVGREAPYYFRAWGVSAYNQGLPPSFFASWNWAAFIVGPLWFAYRKMYAVALAITLFQTVGAWTLFGNDALWTVIMWGVTFMFAIGANWMYYRHCLEKVNAILATYSDARQQQAALIQSGGTSWNMVIALLVFDIIFFVIMIQKLFLAMRF